MNERSDTPAPRLPGLWTLLRDVGSFIGGWSLIFLEVSRPEIREAVLLFAGSVIGIPGIAVGATSILEAIRARNGTASSPSEPAEPASSSSPS